MSIENTIRNILGQYTVDIYDIRKEVFISNITAPPGTILGSSIRNNPIDSVNASISEAIERTIFKRIVEKDRYLINSHPSTCGFAVGLEKLKVSLRSRLEGFERWVFSNWIDHQIFIPQIKTIPTSKMYSILAEDFVDIKLFQQMFSPEECDLPFSTTFGAIVAFTDIGCFLGSRTWFNDENDWDHALAEAWINKRIFDNGGVSLQKKSIIEERILFYGKNKNLGLHSIPKEPIKQWPKATTLLHTEVTECPNPFFMFRTIYNNHNSWTHGDRNRFVY
jgi:hypothetical protein